MVKKLFPDKAIVCSDLHINHWTDYLPTEKQLKLNKKLNPLDFKNIEEYRLNQIIIIAYRIIYECKKNNTDIVFILGDLIHIPNCSPLVLNTLKLFIKTLTSAGITVYYILGQHDLKVRSTDCDIRKDTYVGTLRNSKFIYAHNKQFDLNGHIIECKNFSFDESLIKTKENTEILLSHISLGMGQSPAKNKNLKLCVAGDIHDFVDQTINGVECHSCLTPFPIYPHQSMNGYIGLLDCSGSKPTYTRIKSSGKILVDGKKLDFELFNILTSEDYKKSVLNQLLEEQTEQAISIEGVDTTSTSEKINIRDTVNVEKVVKETAKATGFEDLLSDISLNELPKPLDFNFELDSLIIENFKSIKNLKIDFKDCRGITYLCGKNGAGKSSIINAIETALVTNNRIKTFLRKNEKNLLLDLILYYHDAKYRIIRKISKTEFYKTTNLKLTRDDDWSDFEFELSKRDTEVKISEELPFVDYLNYFICHANSHFFDTVDRTDLIMNIFNLNAFENYKNAIEDLQDEIKDDIKELNVNKTVYEESIKNLNQDKENYNHRLRDAKLDIVQIPDSKQKLKEFNQLLADIKSSESTCKTLKNSIDSVKKSISENLNDELYAEASKALDEIKAYDTVKKTISEQTASLDHAKKLLNDKIHVHQNLIGTTKCKCPNCQHEFYQGNIKEQIEKYQEEIAQERVRISKLENELEFLNQGVTKLSTKYSEKECESIINNYNSAKKLNEQLESLIENQKIEKEKGYSKWTSKQVILKSFQCENDSQYLDLLNANIEYDVLVDTLQKELESVNTKISETEDKLNKTDLKIKKYTDKYNRCEKFKNLFDMENLNSIPYKVIDKVINSLNNSKIRYTSTKELANGENRFDINVELKVGNEWVNYEESSDGQRVLLDSFILYSILSNLGNVGIMVLDEYLANSDNENVSFISTVIGKMSKFVKNIFITSHSDYFNQYDQKMNLKLIDNSTIIVK